MNPNLTAIEHVSAQLSALMGEDFDAETFWDTLDGETDVIDIVGKLLERRAEATTKADAVKAFVAELKEREARLRKRDTSIRVVLGNVLDASGQTKLEHALATVSRTKARENVEITDETAIPSQLCKIEKKPDRAAIKKQLDAGETVPGAALKLGAPGLTIRVK